MSTLYQRGYTRKVDVIGTGRFVHAARGRVRHLLYVSNVGIDQVPWPYFREKPLAEQQVQAGPVPWTIVRATQFHSFMDEMLGKLGSVTCASSCPR